MTLVRLASTLAVGLAVAAATGCVKPGTAPAARSTYDLYHVCGDVNADGVCRQSTEDALKVDTNLAAPAHGSLVALG